MKNVRFSRNGVEFEPTKQELKIVLDDFAKQLGERDKRIADLEAKLAEKEKEIEKITRIVAYRDDVDRSTTINGVKFTNEQIITLQNIDYFADKHNQDKILFAAEQLEKVKEKALHFLVQNTEKLSGFYVDIEEIDNQIKELKKEQENV